jgi:hypothetical protein
LTDDAKGQGNLKYDQKVTAPGQIGKHMPSSELFSQCAGRRPAASAFLRQQNKTIFEWPSRMLISLPRSSTAKQTALEKHTRTIFRAV